MATAPPPIVLTRVDLDRLEALLDSDAAAGIDTTSLADELSRARVVEASGLPADVISLNSTARFRDEADGSERELTLVHPADSDADRHRVSVLAPVGSALLGLSVGQTIDWPLPGGHVATLKVLSVAHPAARASHDAA